MNERLAIAAEALRFTDARFPWVAPTDDEREVGELLAELAEIHEHNTAATVCRGCGERWPCAGVAHAEHLAVQWLGRAADRIMGLQPLPRPDPHTARVNAARAKAERDAAAAAGSP